MDGMKVLVEKLTAPARLVCVGCGDEGGFCVVEARHLLNGPAPGPVVLPSQGLAQFLRLHDGAVFFHVGDRELEGAGLQLFSCAAQAAETRLTQATIYAGISMNPDLSAAQVPGVKAWASQLLIIGRPLGSGDRIALDPSDSLRGEARVVILDHDHCRAGAMGPDLVEYAWDSFEDFLHDFSTVPEEFLATSWRVAHPVTGRQCFLHGVEYL